MFAHSRKKIKCAKISLRYLCHHYALGDFLDNLFLSPELLSKDAPYFINLPTFKNKIKEKVRALKMNV